MAFKHKIIGEEQDIPEIKLTINMREKLGHREQKHTYRSIILITCSYLPRVPILLGGIVTSCVLKQQKSVDRPCLESKVNV